MALKIAVLLEAADLGGPARNLLNVLALLRNDVEFTIVTYQRGPRESAFASAAADAGCAVHVLHERFRYDPGPYFQLRRFLIDAAPDLIQIHNTKSRLFGLLLTRDRRLSKVPQIHFFHGETWVNRKQILYNRLDRHLFRKTERIVVVAEYQRTLLSSWGVDPGRITVIHNGIPVPRGQHVQERIRRSRPCILSVGRLSKEKGHMLLLKAAHDVVLTGEREFSLVIVGDGPERGALEAYVSAHELQPWVSLPGHVADPLPYFRRADLFVLPSFTEGFPNVLLEAALQELPIVASAVGGVPDIFVDGTEIVLLNKLDRKALADRLVDFLQAPDAYRSLGRAARARVQRDYTIDRRAQRLLQYYRQVVAQPASG